MTPSVGWMLFALVLCVCLSAFFSAAETAFSAANRIRIKTMAGDGNKKAARTLLLLDHYDRLITAILIGNNIVNIAATAIATVLFTLCLGDGGATASTVVMTIVVLIFGEVSPKSIAKENPEIIAMAFSNPLRILVVLCRPFDLLFSAIRSGLKKIFHPAGDENHIEDEIISMVDEAQHEGDIDEHEGDLIKSAIEFVDLDAINILTPRVDITAIDLEATVEEAA